MCEKSLKAAASSSFRLCSLQRAKRMLKIYRLWTYYLASANLQKHIDSCYYTFAEVQETIRRKSAC